MRDQRKLAHAASRQLRAIARTTSIIVRGVSYACRENSMMVVTANSKEKAPMTASITAVIQAALASRATTARYYM